MTMPSMPPPLAARWHALSARERALIGAAVVALLLFLVVMLGGEEEEPGVELSAAPPVAAPAPLDIGPAPAPAPPHPAPAGASAEGLVLHGVIGGGTGGGAAIIGFPGGQRWIRIGREFMPGVTLKEVGIRHALLATPAGDMRLEFNKGAQLQASPPVAGAPGDVSAQRRRETLEFRAGLAPREANGRRIGYAIRPGAKLALLQRAGLQPGDVIVKVNGKAFRSGEKVMELSEELATSYTAEIEYLRGGRRMKGTLEVNKRPN